MVQGPVTTDTMMKQNIKIDKMPLSYTIIAFKQNPLWIWSSPLT
jgi:hypothetical protein